MPEAGRLSRTRIAAVSLFKSSEQQSVQETFLRLRRAYITELHIENRIMQEKNNFPGDQGRKSIGWMPRHWEPKKDVVSCEKPCVAANRRRGMDIRMGQPAAGNAAASYDE